MGVSSGIAVHARHRDGPHRTDDRAEAPPQCRGGRRTARRSTAKGAGSAWRRSGLALVLALILALAARPAAADPLRIAVLDTDLARAGPGLLLRDLTQDESPPDAQRAARLVRAADPDAILVLGFDYDAGGAALAAFDLMIGEGTPAYPHRFALRPNTGMATGLDLDGNGRTGEAGDAQGFGRFAGQGGMALLSRLPVDAAGVTDLSAVLWRDLPGADLPRRPDGSPFPSGAAQEVQRLSTTGHWAVPLVLPGGGRLTLLGFHATPPVFDGPEDRNGRRAVDELRLWDAYLSGTLPFPPPRNPFVILGNANLDPAAGDGNRAAMAAFLADARWQDPAGLRGRPTAYWDPPLGALRVDYVLPSAGMRILAAGLLPSGTDADAPTHRLVWVDVDPG